ncbi:metalloenzyme, LuxS/M16 peptidase-like protein [Rhizophagus clarus]|uniref:Metalloenzyme, LuxS/M16 peptidase-like protein n=1 Tax=Rhizophagus clarus TaxID=94130 RepID=A0A8H3LL67_9GLOM|nr:metalloenzyme, LuxS/M16 peptidase-like protein [Rhizophagus clarus]
MTNFEVVKSIETDFNIKITKFRSKATGLTVILVDCQAPLVNGFYAIATEATDDDGCPHTLEHLVFLGSELYPYKGVLDSLANRAFADGTNAWTATDHTCYTIQTAGSQGFLNLLPIYVDHILYPTLTDSGCYTEVHHVNGKGEDAGVVYSEMQGRENSGESRVYLRYKRLMYPEGCGYRSETGGLMENLRVLNVETIRQYHRDYYRPDNLCLIITGKILHDELLKTLNPIDERISKKSSLQIHKRPFVDSAPIQLLEKSIQEEIEFPDEDESMGQVVITWLGPLIDEFLEIKALEILHTYLTDSAASILQKEFVEIRDPLCTDISIMIEYQTRTAILSAFSNVPTEELEELANRVFQVFNRIVENEGIDMDRMKTVIQLTKLRILNKIESSPHYFSDACIVDHVYGKQTGEDLERATKDLKYYDQLLEFTEQQWIQYLKKYHLNNNHITLLGKPSAEFAEKLREQEEKRIEKQRETLGTEKLKELENRLEEAKKLNDAPIPSRIIENFPVPSVDSIPFIKVITGRNKSEGKYKNLVQEHLDHDSKIDIPYFIQYDHINSAFVTISLYIVTTNIPFELRPYINIYLGSFYSLPLTLPDGTKLTFEQVVSQLNKDTVKYDYSLGYNENFQQLVVFHIEVEASKYVKAIQWLNHLLWHTEFTAERLKIVASKLLNEIPEAKRDGDDMASTVMQLINFDEKLSNTYLSSTLYQEKFLPNVIKQLNGDKANQVIQRFYQFRELLTKPENSRIHVSGNILKLANPKNAWAEHFKTIEAPKSLTPVPLSQQFLTEFGRNPGNQGFIVKLPAIESTFSIHTAKGPLGFDSPDLASLLVLFELLQAMEGLFWKLIRGQGLAYGTYLRVNAEYGHIYFDIYKSPDAFKAYEQARKAVFDLADKKIEFDKASFEGAKSGVIYSLVKKEGNIFKAATESFVVQVLKDLDAEYNKNLIAKVQAVNIEDLYPMLTKYLVNLFKPETSNVVVISAPAKVKDIEQGFNGHGFKLKK